MTQHQEFTIKQRKRDKEGLAMAKEQEKEKVLVRMMIPGQKGIYLIDKSRVELRKSQGYYLV